MAIAISAAEVGQMMMKLIATAILALVVGSAQARESIVGHWNDAGAECTPTAGAVSIAPLGLGTDDGIMCDFASVSRKGDVVTWKGTCADGPNDPDYRATVVARLRGQALRISINGTSWNTLYRCRYNQ